MKYLALLLILYPSNITMGYSRSEWIPAMVEPHHCYNWDELRDKGMASEDVARFMINARCE